MFIRIRTGDTINLALAEIVMVFSQDNENVVRMIFPSQMILEMSYHSSERCIEALDAIMTAYGNKEKAFNLMERDLHPDSIRYDRLAIKT